MTAKDRLASTVPTDVATVRPRLTCSLLATAASVLRGQAVAVHPSGSPSVLDSWTSSLNEDDKAPAQCTFCTDADLDLADRGKAVQMSDHAGSAALTDVLRAVPAIFDMLSLTSLAALARVSTEHCLQTYKHATSLSLSTQYAAPLLNSERWPRLKRLQLFDIIAGAPPVDVSQKQHCSNKAARTPSLLSQKATNTAAVSSMIAAQLKQLQHLSISGSLHASALQQIGSASYPALQTLELSHVGMTLEGLQSLLQGSLPMLEVLDLSGNLLNRDAVPTLHAQPKPKLQKLNLAGNRNLLDFFNHAGPFGAHIWPSLMSVDMSYCPLSFRRQLQPISLPQLTSLSLAASWFGLDSDDMLIIVGAHMDNLTSLDLSRNKLNGAAVQTLIFGEWPRLRQLFLSGVSSDSPSMRCLARGKWPNLESLQIQGNNLMDSALQQLFAGAWPALRSIELTVDVWYKYITDKTGCKQNPLHLWQVSSATHRWSVQLCAKPLGMAESSIYMPFWPWPQLRHVVMHDQGK